MSRLLRGLSCRIGITGKNRDANHSGVDVARTCSLCLCFIRVHLHNRDLFNWQHNRKFSDLRHSHFHEPCARCDDVSDISLCDVCKHLRLCHLRHKRELVEFKVDLGELQDVHQRSESCVLCRMIVQECLEECNPESHCSLELDFDLEYKDIDLNIQVRTGDDIRGSFGGVFDSSQAVVCALAKRTIWQQPMVNWSTVHTWLRQCDIKHYKKHHQRHGEISCDNGPLKTPPRGFRVIDTKRGCVVMAPPACRYATLSYVWGGTADNYALATTSNIRTLEEEGYLFKQPLPATIRDSIRACIELKIRYLWIDRLCIVQDDTAAVKDSQINAMGDIYSHSYLTLVDLEGANMDHGLPGVSQARVVRMTYKIPGMNLRIIDEEYPKLVKKSKWNSRGWIFQEAMLSPRMLMFANVGVYFECSQGYQEDRFARRPKLKYIMMSLLFNKIKRYHRIVQDFTSRDLTFSADILKALSGVMHWKFGTEHYFGLPHSEFLGGMLWSPRGLSALETPEVRSTETGDIFPTWSWSSVIAPVEVYSGAGRGSFVGPGIMLGAWGIPSSKTKKLVRIIPSHNPRPSWYEKPQSYEGIGIALMWKEGCFPKPSPSMLNISTTWKNLLALIMSRWASANKLFEEALGIASSSGKMHFERMSCLFYMENADQPGALLSHTQSIHAQIVKRGDQECPSPAIEGYVHLILHSISEIEVDLWIRPNPLHWQFLDHDYSTDHGTKLDVLALSMMCEECATYVCPDEWGLWYDSEGSFLGSDERTMVKFVVNVLIVETRDGLSRRVAIGAVELHDWIAASPEYRNFTLV